MNLTDSRLAQAGNEKLELAMLSFFEQFRKIYIGDQVQKSSKVTHSQLAPLVLSACGIADWGKQLEAVQLQSPGFMYQGSPNVFLVCGVGRLIKEWGHFSSAPCA